MGGGKKTGVLRENPYFEAILVEFLQKWGGAVAPCPPVSNNPEMYLGHSSVAVFPLLSFLVMTT